MSDSKQNQNKANKKGSGLIRQGDVLLMPVQKADDGSLERAPADPRGIVLAEGETSGHFHGVSGDASLFLRAVAAGSNSASNMPSMRDRLLRVGQKGAMLEVIGAESIKADGTAVPRHHAFAIEQGDYRVIIEKRWSPSEYRSREVID